MARRVPLRLAAAAAVLVLAGVSAWWWAPEEDGFQYIVWQDDAAYASLTPVLRPALHPDWTPEAELIVWSADVETLGPEVYTRQLRWDVIGGPVELQVVANEPVPDPANGTTRPDSLWVAAALPIRRDERFEDAGGRLLNLMEVVDPGFNQSQWGSANPIRRDIPLVTIQGPSVDATRFVARQGPVDLARPAPTPRPHQVPVDTSGIVLAWPEVRIEVSAPVWYAEGPEGLLLADGFGRIQLSREGRPWDGADDARAAAQAALDRVLEGQASVRVPSYARVGFQAS